MGSIGTEERDLLQWRDKRKRKRIYGIIGLYLDKRETMNRGMEKTEKEPISNAIQGCRSLSGLGPATLYTHLMGIGSQPWTLQQAQRCSQRKQSPPLSAVGGRHISAPRTKDPVGTCQPEALCWLASGVALP